MSEISLEPNKKIAINDRGIFVLETTKLDVMGITKLRNSFQTRIVSLRMNIQDLERKISSKKQQIANLELALKQLNTPLVDELIAQETEKIRIAKEKAEQLLKETVGSDVYDILQTRGFFKFQAKDGITYKVSKKGHVFRLQNKDWVELCVIRPSELPLPDFVLSLFLNIHEAMKKFPQKHRRW